MSELIREIAKRRTFAIISHPDAGKTTLTERFLLHGKAIALAGTVKAKKAARYATSDWMELEKERGISVTTSVMQFPYHDAIVNLLDTPGHADFSEDTYRTLTAVDSALMVVDVAKGVEERTIKLHEVCRMRDTPIMTFVNKLDREGRDGLEIFDEIEKVLGLSCAPITWPIGSGKRFKGIVDVMTGDVIRYHQGCGERITERDVIGKLEDKSLDAWLGEAEAKDIRHEIELVREATLPFDKELFLSGELTPVFFGTALGNFGIDVLLDYFTDWAPAPQNRDATIRTVEPYEENMTGFVFKIQANMDPMHRDRIAFMRICSGQYKKGMRLKHVRLGRDMVVHNAHQFLAGERQNAEEAFAGDIIGLHNHGTIQVGDTFSEKAELLQFSGIPHFAPELFKRVILKDPLKAKALSKGLQQLSEEGATQLFKPLISNDLILGAVGVLQFDVVAHRLKSEYKVACSYDVASVAACRWVSSSDTKKLEEFKKRCEPYLAFDGSDHLVYLAPSTVNLHLTIERWPDIEFRATREIGA